VRLVRHSCDPSADFTLQLVDCRLRVMLEARGAISADEEITVDWSNLVGSVREKLLHCVRCKEPCSESGMESPQ
jgi:hypothetical protein